MSLLSKVKSLFVAKPLHNDTVKPREDYSKILHKCEMEYWADFGEEDHGVNPYRRRCKHCGRIEYAWIGRLDGELEWKEEVKYENQLPLP